MFCSKCGNQLQDDAKFCQQCGAAVHTADSASDGVAKSPGRIKEYTNALVVKDWLCALFWGSIVCDVLACAFDNNPFWASPNSFVQFVLETGSMVMLTICVLRGARWARISSYVISAFLLLVAGIFLLSGDSSTTFFKTTSSLGVVAEWLALIGFTAGSVLLFVSDTKMVFINYLYLSREYDWVRCLVFWLMLIAAMII